MSKISPSSMTPLSSIPLKSPPRPTGPLWERDPVEYLVNERFPNLGLELRRRLSVEGARTGSGQTGRHLDANEWAALVREANTFRGELRDLSAADLRQRVATARTASAERERLRLVQEEGDRPFNQPYARADFEHWGRCAYWNVEEMTALSLGRSPTYVAWPWLKDLVAKSRFAAEYAARRELISRARTAGQLWDATYPFNFVQWAQRIELVLPSALVEAVSKFSGPVIDWKSLYDEQKRLVEEARRDHDRIHALNLDILRRAETAIAEHRQRAEVLAAENAGLAGRIAAIDVHSQASEKPLGAKERDSLYRLLVAMAVKKYHYKPDALRNSATSRIASDLLEVGLTLDEDTIRKYLAEAKELLPDDKTGGG